jgi:hypothetical protein
MGNHDNLGFIGDIFDQSVEQIGIGIIKGGVHFIQNQNATDGISEWRK